MTFRQLEQERDMRIFLDMKLFEAALPTQKLSELQLFVPAHPSHVVTNIAQLWNLIPDAPMTAG